MAFAVMGGLVVATLLTLVFLPALYVMWFRIEPPGPEHAQTGKKGPVAEPATAAPVG
jgi:hypothetical protein